MRKFFVFILKDMCNITTNVAYDFGLNLVNIFTFMNIGECFRGLQFLIYQEILFSHF